MTEAGMDETEIARADDPAAWTSAEIGGREGLTHRLAPEHVEALHEIVARTRHKPAEAVTREEASHPAVDALMAGVRHEIMRGKGAIILSGIDLDRVSLDEFQRMYWALGTHLGRGAAQSPRRDRIGHVRKEKDNPAARGYLMDIELRSHTDFHEVLSLASVRKSASGGESGIVSALAVHDAILDTRPELLAPLYEGFFHASSGVAGDVSEKKVPIFSRTEGKLSCYFHGLFIVNAARALGVDLPPELVEAIAWFREQAERPDLRADFMLEPGEMMFWHNFTQLHSRTAFSDTDNQRRLLLRLWLNVEGGRPMHPAFAERARYMDAMHEQGLAAIDYAKAASA
jgi:hypothetical protein